MSNSHADGDIDAILRELKTLRLRQAQELTVLLHNHRQQESRVMLRLDSAVLQRTYHDAVDSTSIDDSSIEDVTPAAVTPVTMIPVATRVSSTRRAYDNTNQDLHVGDDVIILNAGSNNDAGDSARIVGIHETRHNWIRVSIYGTEIETYRNGDNLRLTYHEVDPSEASFE